MNQKISPTSAKHPSRQSASVVEELSNPEPVRAPSRATLSWYPSLVLPVLFGFLAGVVGTFAVFRWGPDIGLGDVFFPSGASGIRFLRSGSLRIEDRIRGYDQAVQKVGPVLVPLYAVEKRADNLPEGLYAREAFVGWGVMLSQDGVGVTVSEALASGPVVARVDRKPAQPITILHEDKRIGVVFFSVERDGGTIADLADPETVTAPGGSIFTFQGPLAGEAPVLHEHAVLALNIVPGRSDPLARSSEEIHSAMLVTQEGDLVPGTPLIDEQGHIVGLVRTLTPSGVEATQASLVAEMLPAVLAQNVTDAPYLGVYFLDLAEDPSFADALTLTQSTGAYVFRTSGSAVEKNSPAAVAGIRAGDVIMEVGEKTLGANFSLAEAIAGRAPGDTFSITLIRSGIERTVTVTLGALK